MIYIQSIFFVLICFCLIHLINKINFFQNEKYPHQNFTSRNFVLPVGGYLIILFLLIFNFKTINLNFFFVFFLFLIGALSDLKKFNSPKNRFIAQSLIVFIFIIYSDVKIVSTRLNFLDSLMENYYFSLCFVSFCFLILINGTNFIDGLNGLVVLYYISIILILNLSGLDLKLNTNNFFIDNILLILIFLFILNFIDKIYLGDGGSYILGFLFAYYLISIYDQNSFVSPFFIILLLWYPCFENLFSILRKQKFKKSALEPDTKHFHQLFYNYLSKNLRIKNKLNVNNLTSIIINFYNIIIFFIGSIFITKTNIQVILICFNLFTYLFLYFLLFKYRYKKNI
tara:strand:- start:40 stop:1062 length:1023 start_codon:yes stop_codon:yes gene_type:complete